MNNHTPAFCVRRALTDAWDQAYTPYPGMLIHHLVQQLHTPFGRLNVYFARLQRGMVPHVPHGHIEEELIIAVSGRMEVLFDDQAVLLEAGGMYYMVPDTVHTIRGAPDCECEFFILKWLAPDSDHPAQATHFVHEAFPPAADTHGAAAAAIHAPRPRFTLRSGVQLTPTFVSLPAGENAHPASTVHADATLILLFEGIFNCPATQVQGPAMLYFGPKLPQAARQAGRHSLRYLALHMHLPQ